MKLPDRPHVGLVLCYAYLWADEAKAGQEEGTKDRPAVVVLARRDLGPSEVVYVAPITHSPPTEASEKVEIPPEVKRHLGLDENASFISATEVNVFVWPGPDLRPIRRTRSGQADVPCFYGFLPRGLFEKLKQAIEHNRRTRGVQAIKRGG
jgi:hypothetical protein